MIQKVNLIMSSSYYILFVFVFREYYEPHAILLQEEAMMLHGLLVGLNCIDVHIDIKENSQLDDPVSIKSTPASS